MVTQTNIWLDGRRTLVPRPIRVQAQDDVTAQFFEDAHMVGCACMCLQGQVHVHVYEHLRIYCVQKRLASHNGK